MPTIHDRVDIERRPKLGGGGPGKIPHRRGFGGGDDGDRDGSRNSSSSSQRLRRGRIGVAVGIGCVSTLFIGLTVAYMVRQSTPHWDQVLQREVYDWKPLALPYLQLWINSVLLLLSSFTLELARRFMSRKEEFAVMGIVPPGVGGDWPWLNLTAGLGLGFLAGQVMVWNSLRAHGWYLRANPSSSFFYLLTGLHAAHLAGGLIALLYVSAGRWFRVRFETLRIGVDLTSWYWHFMAFLWFCIFALLHFARG
jgi:cytochrome c oxidase subunit III